MKASMCRPAVLIYDKHDSSTGYKYMQVLEQQAVLILRHTGATTHEIGEPERVYPDDACGTVDVTLPSACEGRSNTRLSGSWFPRGLWVRVPRKMPVLAHETDLP